MGHEVTIGGERLGAGKKMKAYLHNYERSNHDLSTVVRTSMASGTLVPFLSVPALPGDTFDIDLTLHALSHPTIGPLFGTYKIYLDLFIAPVRLYQGQLHMNMLGIGLDMSKILLPQVHMYGPPLDPSKPIDNQHTNPSSILAYMGWRGTGVHAAFPNQTAARSFNAVPFLAYWDIYKQYYANKQEEIGFVIHKDPTDQVVVLTTCNITNADPDITVPINPVPPYTYQNTIINPDSQIQISGTGITKGFDPATILIHVTWGQGIAAIQQAVPITTIFTQFTIDVPSQLIIGYAPNLTNGVSGALSIGALTQTTTEQTDVEPQLTQFPLENIDIMRKLILKSTDGVQFVVNKQDDPNNPGNYLTPYSLPFENNGTIPPTRWSQLFSQEGLAIRTYSSDLFNNWIQTEWIDGPDGVSAVTAIDTTSGSFTIDELNLHRKIYDMLNRIAISGGSYDDWLDAVYTEDRHRSAENPMYLGGLIQNIVFQEVISNTQTPSQPLGTLAGRGTLGQKRKGGKVIAKVQEPSYIIGIASIVPNIDYSQGNTWDSGLQTMNDFHKPALDQIGFQDLITDQMAWWDTVVTDDPTVAPQYKSAGKQPAWINYMTNVNKVYGNFADVNQQMFMVLNRRYDVVYSNPPTINDLTTYIDPTKFNHIFADTRRDAQNFWVQIGVQMEARRKMSAKVMPNL